MAEYELSNVNHNDIGDPHPQYDSSNVYKSLGVGSQVGARVKLFEMPIILDVTDIINNDYYNYKSVRRLDVGFKVTDPVSENTSLTGDVFISTYVRNGGNDNVDFSDSSNFRGFGTVNWHITGDYRTPTVLDTRLEISMFVKKDSTYIDKSGVSRYIVSVYSSTHQYGLVTVQPTSISWDISRMTVKGNSTSAFSATNPFANPHSNTKEKYDWVFGNLTKNSVLSKSDFDAMRLNPSYVRIPVVEQNGIIVLDSYSSIDIKDLVKLLHLPIDGHYQIEIRNSSTVNGPAKENNKWLVVDILYTPAQRTITLYYPSNNAYRATEKGYNTGTWSDWKAI